MNFDPVLMKWAEKRSGGGSVPETEAKTVSLALAGGNQIVTPTDGKLLSEVTIEKPANLLPENIAEGVNIAGVIGALAMGSSAKIAVGAVATDATFPAETSHGLGVVPDIIVFDSNQTVAGELRACVAFSKAFAQKLGYAGFTLTIGKGASGSLSYSFTTTASAWTADGTYGNIVGANEETFTVKDQGSFGAGAASGNKWLAIGGLT